MGHEVLKAAEQRSFLTPDGATISAPIRVKDLKTTLSSVYMNAETIDATAINRQVGFVVEGLRRFTVAHFPPDSWIYSRAARSADVINPLVVNFFLQLDMDAPGFNFEEVTRQMQKAHHGRIGSKWNSYGLGKKRLAYLKDALTSLTTQI